MGSTKATSIKDSLTKFEEKFGIKIQETDHIKLWHMIPPIEKMDASLSTLTHCVQLSLSTNQIEKIANLNGLKNLRILSLGRNSIKSLTGLEAVGETLQELWISYNQIEKLKGINVLKKLKALKISHNMVKDIGEISRLAELPCLEDLVFVGNPLEKSLADPDKMNYTKTMQTKLTKLKKLDGEAVIRDEGDGDQEQL